MTIVCKFAKKNNMNEDCLIKNFGVFLYSLRTDKKISQERLAELCQLDRTYISLLERGHRQPTLMTLFKISKAFDLSLSYLLGLFEKQYENR